MIMLSGDILAPNAGRSDLRLKEAQSDNRSVNYRELAKKIYTLLKGQYHGRYHDFGQKFTKFKL